MPRQLEALNLKLIRPVLEIEGLLNWTPNIYTRQYSQGTLYSLTPCP